ncbi:MAG: site-specific integrase [Candidatus Competibacteraceae bacterium]
MSVSDIHQYTQTRRREGVTPATVNRELGLLSAVLNWGRITLGWDIPNPAQGQGLSEPTGRERWLTQREAAQLLEAARQEFRAPHLLDYILIALNTGMRSGEILSLEWDRVDFKQDRILLGANHRKNGKPGMVPLNQTARSALLFRACFRAQHCPATPWVFSDRAGRRIASIKRSFASACRRAGIEDCTPHDLRRTCGSWRVQNRVPIQEVAKLLRHADIRVTERVYAHLLPDQLKTTVQVLDRHDLVTLEADRTQLDRLSRRFTGGRCWVRTSDPCRVKAHLTIDFHFISIT